MPETITSWLFWLFMFLRMGWIEPGPGRSPVWRNSATSSTPLVPSLSEALEPFSAVILTGGSSGIGKSFIEVGQTLKPELLFCNLSRRSPEKNSSHLNLNHFPCDLSRGEEIERASLAVRRCVESSAGAGRVLLVNNSGFGAYGYFPAPELSHHLAMIDVN